MSICCKLLCLLCPRTQPTQSERQSLRPHELQFNYTHHTSNSGNFIKRQEKGGLLPPIQEEGNPLQN